MVEKLDFSNRYSTEELIQLFCICEVSKKNIGAKLSQKDFLRKFNKEAEKCMSDFHSLSDNMLREKYAYKRIGSFGMPFAEEYNSLLRWCFEKNKNEQGDNCYSDFYSFIEKTESDSNNLFAKYLKKRLSNSKKIEIDRLLLPLLLATDNDIHYRNLPFDDIFLDVCIEVRSGVLVEGILIQNFDYETATSENQQIMDTSMKRGDPEKTYNKNIAIRYFHSDYNNLFETIGSDELNIFLNEISIEELNSNDDFNDLDDTSKKELQNTSKKLFTFLFNILDMLHNNQVEKYTTKIPDTKNNKRIKKGLAPLPTTTIRLKPKEELYRYAKKFNEDAQTINHKFLVRGHYRHFRNKDKYTDIYQRLENKSLSEEYIVTESGLVKTWIKPHYRGEGILVEKNIKIKE